MPIRSPLARRRRSPRPAVLAGIAVAATLGALFVANRRRARQAERANPPKGDFLQIAGVSLHYLDRGQGEPLVLLHGNGSMIEDFGSSGLIERAAARYRVIAFDRPGYGHSTRPRDRIWTAAAQADLLHAALRRLGVERAIVLGHSWGASVAVAMAEKYPETVSGLVLASGYYYPTFRPDFAALSVPAFPGLGDILRHTVAPPLARASWPLLLRKIFGPEPVPEKFREFPREMALRPSHIRASAAESALLVPVAFAASRAYRELAVPAAIVAGDEDRLVDTDAQSARLHSELPDSTLRRLPGRGHMIHQTALDDVMAAINEVSGRSDQHGNAGAGGQAA